jgi:hypothetical protein
MAKVIEVKNGEGDSVLILDTDIKLWESKGYNGAEAKPKPKPKEPEVQS